MHSGLVTDVREELSAEPRQLSPRTRLLVGGGAALLACASLLTGSHPPGCTTSAPGPSTAAPWATSDDPLVRSLHFSALDRARAPHDLVPAGVLASDVAPTSRDVGAVDGVQVYLARGHGFTCLAVDGRKAGYAVAQQCLLDVTVANRGLYLSVGYDTPAGTPVSRWPPDQHDSLLVVAVPDDATVLTGASTEHMADLPNAAVLRPSEGEVLLQRGDRPPVTLQRAVEDVPAGC